MTNSIYSIKSLMEQAIERLSQGQVVAMPTETVYGLAARIDSETGIQKIFSTKQRPFFDPLIVHVSSKAMAQQLTNDWSPLADFLSEHFWPGPLTLVLPKAASVNPMITSGLETVGIRMPKHSLALSLIEKATVPLAAPSANRFGRTSPTTADHVRSEFPKEDLLILDGGACQIGLESTVLFIRRQAGHYSLSVLRSGAVTRTEIEKSLSHQKFSYSFEEKLTKRESPGQMKHHYMPEIPLVLIDDPQMALEDIKREARKQMAQLPDEVEGVSIRKPRSIEQIGELKLPTEAHVASRLLYSELRSLGESGQFDLIFFRRPPGFESENWGALRDRLLKASSLILGNGQ